MADELRRWLQAVEAGAEARLLDVRIFLDLSMPIRCAAR
jgi:hypothetical protein